MSPQEHQLTKEQEKEVQRRVQNPTPEIPQPRLFKVRRMAWTSGEFPSGPVLMASCLTEEGIEAHRMEEHPSGNLIFYRYTEAHNSEQGVWYNFRIEKLLAAGSYYDIVEVSQEFEIRSVN